MLCRFLKILGWLNFFYGLVLEMLKNFGIFYEFKDFFYYNKFLWIVSLITLGSPTSHYWLCVVIISFFLNSTSGRPIYTFLNWDVVISVHLYITSIFWQSPLSGHSYLMRQLHYHWYCCFICVIFLLCPFIIWDLFWVQL